MRFRLRGRAVTEPVTVPLRPAADAADTAAGPAAAASADLRLARLHLRLGMVAVARAELEEIEHRGALDRDGLAALAEARWRTGDLAAAGDAARAHVNAGGANVIALVIAAEDAAAAGEVADARAIVERLRALDATALDLVFGGMPRRAQWPAAAIPLSAAAASAPPPSPATRPVPPGPVFGGVPGSAARSSAVPGPGDVIAATPQLWDTEGTPGGGISAPDRGPGIGVPVGLGPSGTAWSEPSRQRGHSDPDAELEVARAELDEAPDRGLLRLALVLRLDPTLAPDVLEAIRLRPEPAAAIVRGDAERLIGRHLEAEAAFADAAEAIARSAAFDSRAAPQPPGPHAMSQPPGPHAPSAGPPQGPPSAPPAGPRGETPAGPRAEPSSEPGTGPPAAEAPPDRAP